MSFVAEQSLQGVVQCLRSTKYHCCVNLSIEFDSRSAELARLNQVKGQCSAWQALGIRWPSRQDGGRNTNKQQRITMPGEPDACTMSWRQVEMHSRLIRAMNWEPHFTSTIYIYLQCSRARGQARPLSGREWLHADVSGSTESTARQKNFLNF